MTLFLRPMMGYDWLRRSVVGTVFLDKSYDGLGRDYIYYAPALSLSSPISLLVALVVLLVVRGLVCCSLSNSKQTHQSLSPLGALVVRLKKIL